MGKIVISEWMSLDGVFDAQMMDEWWNPYHSEGRAAHIQAGINSCEAMLYGKATYQMLAPYWSSQKKNEMGVAAKLNSVRKYVVSATLAKAEWENSVLIKENHLAAIAKLKEEAKGEILVNGSGLLASSLLTAGMVDELRFLIQPKVMGKGRRFFAEGMRADLELTRSETLEKGVLALWYKPKQA